jgi:hypothetical protein
MQETSPIRASETYHNTCATVRLTWRNAVGGAVASAFHRIAWLLTPSTIPKALIGNRSRKGHFSSLGSTATSVDCT